MSEQTMKDIKAGKGLKSLADSNSSTQNQSGVTTEQRTQKGIIYENFTRNQQPDNKK